MTYKDILYFGTCVVGLNTNNIFSCCSSAEQKLSKEYIAKALGVTVDKIWAFEVFSAEDAAKYNVKDKNHSGIIRPKIIVDNVGDDRYSNSCFVALQYSNVEDPKKSKFCVALVSDKNSIKVNNEMLVEKVKGGDKEYVMMLIYNNYDAFISKIIKEATDKTVELKNEEVVNSLVKSLYPTFISEGLIKQYFCK